MGAETEVNLCKTHPQQKTDFHVGGAGDNLQVCAKQFITWRNESEDHFTE